MTTKTLEQFSASVESSVKAAITDDEFLTIKTDVGNAVLISEDEWNILVDAMKQIIASI